MPSTAIRSFRYDAVRRNLHVRFLAAPEAAYVYLDVPQAFALGLELARSKGAFVNREIKPRFRCIRLVTAAPRRRVEL